MSRELDPFPEQRSIWRRKSALRMLYADFQERLMEAAGGSILEIGAGSGCLKEALQHGGHFSLDRHSLAQADVTADAHDMPFKDQSFDTIVMIDTFHHLQNPLRFLSEASRVLRKGGRIAMVEPGISTISGLFYRMFHDEPVSMTEDPFADRPPNRNWGPFDANQAIPTLMFIRDDVDERFQSAGIPFRMVRCEWLSLFAYPLSGGFRKWQLIPAILVKPVLDLERRLIPILGPVMAFRLHVALERTDVD